jgi:hypothetical protein
LTLPTAVCAFNNLQVGPRSFLLESSFQDPEKDPGAHEDTGGNQQVLQGKRPKYDGLHLHPEALKNFPSLIVFSHPFDLAEKVKAILKNIFPLDQGLQGPVPGKNPCRQMQDCGCKMHRDT